MPATAAAIIILPWNAWPVMKAIIITPPIPIIRRPASPQPAKIAIILPIGTRRPGIMMGSISRYIQDVTKMSGTFVPIAMLTPMITVCLNVFYAMNITGPIRMTDIRMFRDMSMKAVPAIIAIPPVNSNIPSR
jgi:hypothetical protein